MNAYQITLRTGRGGCHVTELREGAWTLAQNFDRTVGVVSDGS
jgi:hypothetical protein